MDTIKRIAAPDEKRDFRGEVISILSPGTVLKESIKFPISLQAGWE